MQSPFEDQRPKIKRETETKISTRTKPTMQNLSNNKAQKIQKRAEDKTQKGANFYKTQKPDSKRSDSRAAAVAEYMHNNNNSIWDAQNENLQTSK